MKEEPAAFPWDAAIAFGIGFLRLESVAFWRLTPAELAALHRGFFGQHAQPHPARTDLAGLMRRFPDQ